MSRKTDIYQLAGSDASLNNTNKGTEAGMQQVGQFYESRRAHQKAMIDRLNLLDQLIAKNDTIIGTDAQGNPIKFSYPANELATLKAEYDQIQHSNPGYTNANGSSSFRSSEMQNKIHPDFQQKLNNGRAEFIKKIVSDTYNNANNDDTVKTEMKNYLSYDQNYAKATPEEKIAMEETAKHQIVNQRIMGVMGYDGYKLLIEDQPMHQKLTEAIDAVLGKILPTQALPQAVPAQAPTQALPQAVPAQAPMQALPMQPLTTGVPYTNAGPYFQPDRLPQMFRVPMSNNAGTGGRLNILNYKQ